MKKIILGITGLILLLAIPMTVFLVGRQQELRSKAAPATTLELSPATVTTKVGETFTLEVRIDSGENQILAAELHLTYDPTKMIAESATNGVDFPNILSKIDEATKDPGVINATLQTANPAEPFKGIGTVAILRFKALAPTDSPTTIRFADTTFLGDQNEGATNALIGSTSASITISGDESTATIPDSEGTFSSLGSTMADTPSSPILPPLDTTPTPESTSASVQIISPSDDGNVTTSQPTIKGKAPPGSTVTITIHSTPQTVVVTADANGNWVYTPTDPLESGPHNVVVTAQSGTSTQTATSAFVVTGGTEDASASAMPVSGNTTYTMIAIIIGSLCILMGLILPRLSSL